jgi:hypothetical protein
MPLVLVLLLPIVLAMSHPVGYSWSLPEVSLNLFMGIPNLATQRMIHENDGKVNSN